MSSTAAADAVEARIRAFDSQFKQAKLEIKETNAQVEPQDVDQLNEQKLVEFKWIEDMKQVRY